MRRSALERDEWLYRILRQLDGPVPTSGVRVGVGHLGYLKTRAFDAIREEFRRLQDDNARLRADLGDVEGREASVADLANSWAREESVLGISHPRDTAALVDRLWASSSAKAAYLARKAEAAEARVRALEDTLREWRSADVHAAAITLGMRFGDKVAAADAVERAARNLRVIADAVLAVPVATPTQEGEVGGP